MVIVCTAFTALSEFVWIIGSDLFGATEPSVAVHHRPTIGLRDSIRPTYQSQVWSTKTLMTPVSSPPHGHDAWRASF